MDDVIVFDTYEVINKFIQIGFTEDQAVLLANEQKAIIEKNLATKRDLAKVEREIEGLKKETIILGQKFERGNGSFKTKL